MLQGACAPRAALPLRAPPASPRCLPTLPPWLPPPHRSRDGRVNPPKLGLLRMVVDAAAAPGGAGRVRLPALAGRARLQGRQGVLCTASDAPPPPLNSTHTPPPPSQPVYLVPTAMNYDSLLEEGALGEQLAGAAKRSESLGGLAGCGPSGRGVAVCWGEGALAACMHSAC